MLAAGRGKDAFLRTPGCRRANIGSHPIICRIDEATRRVMIVHFHHTLQDYGRDLLHFIDRQHRDRDMSHSHL